MLPQALVQNKIINKSSSSDFQLYWPMVAPILNANYFYVNSLIDGSSKYRRLLRPWEEIEPPTAGESLKLHQFYHSDVNNSTYNIHIGDLVGRVRNTNANYLNDCLVIAPSTQCYIYDSEKQAFVLSGTAGKNSCVFRPNLWGLSSILSVSFQDTNIRLVDGFWQYNCSVNLPIFISYIKPNTDQTYSPKLGLSTDRMMGRILYDNEVIAHVPVTIIRQWNEQLIDYEFILQFLDLNFPRNSTVEFW